MFNKENNKIVKIELEANNLYRQYDNISITPSFIKMLNNYYESKNMEYHLDYDNRVKLYKDNNFLLKMKKQYNTNIVNLGGITTTSIIFASPNPSSYYDYCDSKVILSAITNGQIVFRCITEPQDDLQANVMFWESHNPGMIFNCR